MIALLASAFAVAATASPADYQMNLEIVRTDGEMRHVTAWEAQVVIRDGDLILSPSPDGAVPLISGDIDVDEAKGEVFAAFKICAPEKDPCDVIAAPSLLFGLGQPVAVKINGGEFSIDLSFDPLAD